MYPDHCHGSNAQTTLALMTSIVWFRVYPLQLSPDCKFKATQVDFVLGREQFGWSGLTPVSPGYTEVYSWHAVESAESAARFEKGQSWDVDQVGWLLSVGSRFLCSCD